MRSDRIFSPNGIFCKALFSDPPDTSVCPKADEDDEEEPFFGTQVNISEFVYQKAMQGNLIVFKHAAGSHAGQVT
jgi:hypothetical protein